MQLLTWSGQFANFAQLENPVTNQATTRPVVLIFMGVAGSGKTTVAKLFASKTGATFVEGDDFHPPENVARMRAGVPLTDADRKSWLQALRRIVAGALAKNEFTALTCSALKVKYRDELSAGDSRVKFVHLTGSKTVLEERLKGRRGHFMSPALLESQLADLEPPPDALIVNFQKSPKKIVAEVIQSFALV
ncbi:MAG TPA: gluconokinase [Candidatus Acidoferrum sp.]|nr:gluconokinase [Candidatus Acidoferrum sp.]